MPNPQTILFGALTAGFSRSAIGSKRTCTSCPSRLLENRGWCLLGKTTSGQAIGQMMADISSSLNSPPRLTGTFRPSNSTETPFRTRSLSPISTERQGLCRRMEGGSRINQMNPGSTKCTSSRFPTRVTRCGFRRMAGSTRFGISQMQNAAPSEQKGNILLRHRPPGKTQEADVFLLAQVSRVGLEPHGQLAIL
jgi:hypothetical protein